MQTRLKNSPAVFFRHYVHAGARVQPVEYGANAADIAIAQDNMAGGGATPAAEAESEE